MGIIWHQEWVRGRPLKNLWCEWKMQDRVIEYEIGQEALACPFIHSAFCLGHISRCCGYSSEQKKNFFFVKVEDSLFCVQF